MENINSYILFAIGMVLIVFIVRLAVISNDGKDPDSSLITYPLLWPVFGLIILFKLLKWLLIRIIFDIKGAL